MRMWCGESISFSWIMAFHRSRIESSARLRQEAEHALVLAVVIVVDPGGQEQMRYLKPENDDRIKHRALMANPLAHSTTLYRREPALKVGGYDETLAGFQDWDLWLKLGKLGKLYNFPDYFLYYRVWQGSGSFSQSKRNTESALRITRRHRHDYTGYPFALTMAMLYHGYAHLPVGVQRVSVSATRTPASDSYAESYMIAIVIRPVRRTDRGGSWPTQASPHLPPLAVWPRASLPARTQKDAVVAASVVVAVYLFGS